MSGGSTTTKENKPWDEQIPYLTAGFDQAANLYNKGTPDYYSGETLAGFSPAQAAAQRGTANYITGPRAGAQQAYAEKAQMGGLTGGVDTSTFNPMMESLGRQMQSQLTGSVLPGIRSKMVQYQPGGSSRGDLVQSQAISSANQQMLRLVKCIRTLTKAHSLEFLSFSGSIRQRFRLLSLCMILWVLLVSSSKL